MPKDTMHRIALLDAQAKRLRVVAPTLVHAGIPAPDMTATARAAIDHGLAILEGTHVSLPYPEPVASREEAVSADEIQRLLGTLPADPDNDPEEAVALTVFQLHALLTEIDRLREANAHHVAVIAELRRRAKIATQPHPEVAPVTAHSFEDDICTRCAMHRDDAAGKPCDGRGE